MNVEVKLLEGWELAAQILGAAPKKVRKAISIAVFREAHRIASDMRRRYREGPHIPLSPLTLAARRHPAPSTGRSKFGGSKPLIVTGSLAAAPRVVPATPDDSARYFVGILRNAKSKDGRALVSVAEIHEFGKTIVMKLTPKMRRYLFGVLLKQAGASPNGSSGSGTGLIVIRIPARPVIRPAFEAAMPHIADNIRASLAKMLPEFAGNPQAFQGGLVSVTTKSE